MRIQPADVGDPAFVQVLEDHLRDLEPTAPPESRHALDLSGLQAPGVRVWVGVLDGRLVATAALAPVDDGHEELKSMRTDPAVRGQGIATAMLAHVIADATARGVQRVSLETGSVDFFAAARALYARNGFTECGPFGAYAVDPHSVYMTRLLRSPA